MSEIDFLLLDVDSFRESCEPAGSLSGPMFCIGMCDVYGAETEVGVAASGDREREGEFHSRLSSEVGFENTDLGRYGIPAAAA